MVDIETFRKSASVIKDAYETDENFRKAVIASALSAITELKGSHSDEEIAAVVAERIFGDS
jgi:hypothetical protein